jgi:two-component system, OmpR family, phosphate regulon sensor histidine kinase PhoR
MIRGRPLRSIILVAGLVLLVLAFADAPRWLIAMLGSALLLLGMLTLVNRATRRPSLPENTIQDSSQMRMTALFDAIALPVITVDQQGHALSINAAAKALYPALTQDAPLSFAIRNPQLIELLTRALEDRHASEMELVEKVPVERSFSVNIQPLAKAAAHGLDEAAIITMQDMTSMRRTEQMRVDFIANASHELRTPLASIMGFVDTLQGPAKDDKVARERFLGIMAEQGQRMARLIEDLLSLSRIEQSAHVMPETDLDVIALLRRVIDSLSALAYERGVKLGFHDMRAQGILVKGDRDELIRVFENLIENAIKYGQTGGRVEIAAMLDKPSDEIIISIQDFGPGIAPEHLPRLTERFYRVDIASSRDKGGTGLGLAIVKHILNRHRGRLRIESQPQKGATFSVVLPALHKTAEDIEVKEKSLSQN